MALRLFDSIYANIWLKGSKFCETSRLYYWLTCVCEKVEIPASFKFYLTIFHPSGQTAYAPYLSGHVCIRRHGLINNFGYCPYLFGQIAYTQT